jgi:fumarate hydratase subunit beta
MSTGILTPPLTDAVVESLHSEDRVFITGDIFSARDTAHKRLVELLDAGKPLPFDIAGQIIYYVGPTPARPGMPVGSCGPTTSSRMDSSAPRLMEQGLKGMIGKGQRSAEVIEAMKRYRAVYFAAIGGAGAMLAHCVKKTEIIAYEDLGPEAIRKFTVEMFPVVVINDVHGNDLYRQAVNSNATV